VELSSKAIIDGAKIDAKYSKGGDNLSPDLAWTSGPPGTKSYAVTCFDPDAPTGSGWWHWIAADIPADATSLPEGGPLPAGARQWPNDAENRAYDGPAPPPGPVHHYVFTVFALDVDKLPVGDDAGSASARFTLYQHILEQDSITGLFSFTDRVG
jgi:Raf kinase inhibitor-like YbhB/YbcL family protein